MLNIREYFPRRWASPPDVALAQGPIGRIVHHQKRRIVLYAAFQHAYDMWMSQTRDSLRFAEKVFQALIIETNAQHFQRSPRFEVDVFAQVYIGESTFPDQLQQLIVAEPLSYTICHGYVHHSEFFLLKERYVQDDGF